MGRVGFIIPGLVMCGLLVSACSSSGSPAAPEKPGPARPATEAVRVGRLTEVFDTSIPPDPAQASVVEGFRAGMILWDKSQEDLTLASPARLTSRAMRCTTSRTPSPP